ncbi:pilus assembly protein PilC [Acidovorax sp. SRB_14]|uniref:pilus assembly protein n=1 Tax=Acidovorax sp. SRB_14 TaxID=1962699 RepID=UPI00156647D9|nr:PilC/PilY family type IV pilus protein [Acidovorax sp. SRB_14]NMM82093.1 pilus assembly protein PilC [Acidovorax sp. SRB_14]
MPRNTSPRFRKTLLALAAGAALAPHGAWALTLAEAPPGTVEPYVTPNVIISIDDSGSMNYCLTLQKDGKEGTSSCAIEWDKNGNPTKYANAIDTKVPNADGTWPGNSRRINVLKYALIGDSGMGGVFRDTAVLPDKKIRMAWQAMNANNGTPGNVNTGTTAQTSTNSMKVLNQTHRDNFIAFTAKLTPGSSTPSHKMFKQADEYMRLSLNQNGPWSSNPGGSDAASKEYLGCRRNYHIMMTDGRWNGTVSGGSQDDNTKNQTLPFGDSNGMVFGSTNAAMRPNNRLYHDSYSNTLADWAFYSWAKPLQTSGLTGTMQPATDYRKAPATENFGNDKVGNPAILDRYWNPRYNPATWPHMVTYTIGFSTMAVTWPKAPEIIGPTDKVPFGYDNSFLDLVTGNKKWPDMGIGEEVRSLDLWHAALNGRGRFYAVTQGEDLEKAFRDIFGQINTLNEPDLTSTATSGANTSRNDVGKFTGAYEPINAWKGFVTAETVQKDGTTVSAAGWGGKNTADKLDALTNVNNRLVLGWSDKWSVSRYQGGVPFQWANDETNLSSTQKALLGLNPGATGVTVATNGQNRLNFIRGDRSLEGSESSGYTTAKPFRERKSRQGDIVNSVVWYTGAPASNHALKGYAAFTRSNAARPAMIYVGGNDGMLHGFSADDGSEKIAYVPRGVIPTLPLLTAPQYNNKHKYFVDGSPMTGDVDMGTGVQDPDDPAYNPDYAPSWRTLLVGTLGAGGKGYFVLDVTNPTATDASDGTPGFAEGNAQKLVKLDRTRGASEALPNCALTGMSDAEKTACTKAVEEDKDLGHITARPVLDESNPMRTTQITRMNNNRWAAVMGNGYNSVNQRPVLLIQYLDGAQELLRIPVTTDVAGSGNAADNGLSAPRLADLNGDGRPDVAYAGDNLGNMWKFDLTNMSDTAWGVGFGGQPLFTAKGPTALNSPSRPNIQPITIAPTVRANDRTMTAGTGSDKKTVNVGGMMVAFGTGRNVADKDSESVQVQTLYSVLDNTRYRVISTIKGKRLEVHPGEASCSPPANCVPQPKALGDGVINAKLAEQKITELSGGDFATLDVKNAENELKKETWGNYNGWYMDLPAVGERLLKPLEFYDGSNILAMYSQVPAKGSDVDPNKESCDSTSVDEERQYRTLVNIMDGKRPTVQLVDKNGDGIYNATDANVSRVRVSKGSHTLITQRNKVIDIDVKNNKEALARMPEQSLRPSWRQVR